MSQTKVFTNTTRIVSGLGSIDKLPEELKRLGCRRPALVLDEGVASLGLHEKWLPSGIDYVECGRSRVNPDLGDVKVAIERAREAQCDGVIALGGGSAICLAKAVGILITNPGEITQYEGNGNVPTPRAPTICIPTTAGSGSEVSNALVLHEKGRDAEIVVRGHGCEPSVAILDGALLLSLPRRPFLEASLDALTHCCEALWVRNRSTVTDAHAEKALRLILDLLPRAINEEKRDPAILQKLIEASTVANLACGCAGLGLVHAITTSPEVPLAHGYQNGCVLLQVANFNRAVMTEEHAALVDGLSTLFTKLGWTGKFQTGEITKARADLMVKASTGHPFRLNNARESTDEDIYAILRASGAEC